MEIQPRNGSHYLVTDAGELSRHNILAAAEAFRAMLISEVASQLERQYDLISSGTPKETDRSRHG